MTHDWLSAVLVRLDAELSARIHDIVTDRLPPKVYVGDAEVGRLEDIKISWPKGGIEPSTFETSMSSPATSMQDLVAEIVRRRAEEDEAKLWDAVERAKALEQGVLVAWKDGRVAHAEPSPYVPRGMAYWLNQDALGEGSSGFSGIPTE